MERKSIILNSYKKDSLDDLVNALESDLSGTLVTRSNKVIGTTTIILVVFEKYYMRVGSYVSLTVLMLEDNSKQRIELTGSGGGNGIFGIDWGANQDFADSAKNILVKKGFTEKMV